MASTYRVQGHRPHDAVIRATAHVSCVPGFRIAGALDGRGLASYVLMFTLSRILVPSDFGPPSVAALDYALGLASAASRRVRDLVSCVRDPRHRGARRNLRCDTRYGQPDPVVPRNEALEAVAVASVKARAAGASLDTMLREGRPWEAILEAAQAVGADMIVMGTHGRHGLVRALLGSVTEKVVRTSAVPVLVVHYSAATPPERDLRPRGAADAPMGRSLG